MDERATNAQSVSAARAETPSRLLPIVYDELRDAADRLLAREAPGQTLQATALVHEAYLRLTKGESKSRWNGSGHFTAVVVEVMRRILVESARRKKRLKRGGDVTRQDLAPEELAEAREAEHVLALDEALTVLAEVNINWAELIKRRYFLGMTVPEAAQSLGVSPRTADAWWASARLWLQNKLALDISEVPP